ncbi:hypothetical protein HPB50_023367 [Hyalomma asiaticum]|uniref:Uncharacterized protein n=1 Tax=Hyalomma asiaticum TaxID=266040 RepID=A0ACB7SS05_HYAAI|nr:hypothetical protein HPB50_023367 [Hyalomma asiaticum]
MKVGEEDRTFERGKGLRKRTHVRARTTPPKRDDAIKQDVARSAGSACRATSNGTHDTGPRTDKRQGPTEPQQQAARDLRSQTGSGKQQLQKQK